MGIKIESIILFLVLLFAFIVCCFLGSRRTNCNREGFDSGIETNTFTGTETPTNYYSTNGNTAKIIQNGTDASIIVTNADKSTDTFSLMASDTSTPKKYYDPSGNSAVIYKDDSTGYYMIKEVDSVSKVETLYTSKKAEDKTESNGDYNNYTGAMIPTKYYASDDSVATIILLDSKPAIQITGSTDYKQNFTLKSDKSSGFGQTYYDPSNNTAIIYQDAETSNYRITVGNYSTGNSVAYFSKVHKEDDHKEDDDYKDYVLFTGPSGNTAIIMMFNEIPTIIVKNSNGSKTNYIMDTRNGISDVGLSTYYAANGDTAKFFLNSDNSFGFTITTTTGSVTTYYGPSPINTPNTSYTSNYDYSNYLPSGVPGSQIPIGSENLYILKTQVVPPVCPMCPSVIQSSPVASTDTNKDKDTNTDTNKGTNKEKIPSITDVKDTNPSLLPLPSKTPLPTIQNYDASSRTGIVSRPLYMDNEVNTTRSTNYSATAFSPSTFGQNNTANRENNMMNNQNSMVSSPNIINNQFLPVPVLSDFSGFGM